MKRSFNRKVLQEQICRNSSFLLVICVPMCSAFNCTDPKSFSCTPEMVQELSTTPFSQWYTLSGDATKSYASTWLQKSAVCCRHCVWIMGYPLFDPIVVATDRTTSSQAQYLDCIQFQVQQRNLECFTFSTFFNCCAGGLHFFG